MITCHGKGSAATRVKLITLSTCITLRYSTGGSGAAHSPIHCLMNHSSTRIYELEKGKDERWIYFCVAVIDVNKDVM